VGGGEESGDDVCGMSAVDGYSKLVLLLMPGGWPQSLQSR
jgi:hypothetical protein